MNIQSFWKVTDYADSNFVVYLVILRVFLVFKICQTIGTVDLFRRRVEDTLCSVKNISQKVESEQIVCFKFQRMYRIDTDSVPEEIGFKLKFYAFTTF